MPIYEYRCETCGRSEELLETLSAAESHDCGCGEPQGMRRQFSVPALASLDGYAAAEPPCASGGGCGGGSCPFAGA